MGVKGMFLFPEAVTREPAIEAWLKTRAPELRSLAQRWFSRMRGCGGDVREILHDGHPTACVGEAAFGYVNVFTAHANVGFFYGAALPDPHRLLEGDGKRMRHVKVRPNAPLDERALAALIDAAYADIKARLERARIGSPSA